MKGKVVTMLMSLKCRRWRCAIQKSRVWGGKEGNPHFVIDLIWMISSFFFIPLYLYGNLIIFVFGQKKIIWFIFIFLMSGVWIHDLCIYYALSLLANWVNLTMTYDLYLCLLIFEGRLFIFMFIDNSCKIIHFICIYLCRWRHIYSK